MKKLKSFLTRIKTQILLWLGLREKRSETKPANPPFQPIGTAPPIGKKQELKLHQKGMDIRFTVIDQQTSPVIQSLFEKVKNS